MTSLVMCQKVASSFPPSATTPHITPLFSVPAGYPLWPALCTNCYVQWPQWATEAAGGCNLLTHHPPPTYAVLHLPGFSDGTLVTGMLRTKETPFRVMIVLMPCSTCRGSSSGFRLIKVMRPKFFGRACFDVIRPADGRYNQLTQQRRHGRKGVSLRGKLIEFDQWECLGLVM